MGAEGVPWLGLAPFVAEPHLFQNLGDGTLSHSGTLAIRASVAAGVNVTFKVPFSGNGSYPITIADGTNILTGSTNYTVTGSFVGGIYFLSGAMLVSAAIIFYLKLGRKEAGT